MVEIEAVLRQKTAQVRAANMRAGLIAAAVYNNNPYRRKGSRVFRAADFLEEPSTRLDASEAVAFMDRWTTQQNKVAAKQRH